MAYKVRILPFLRTFTQLNARLKNFLRGWLLVLSLKEGLVECATVGFKSEVILPKVWCYQKFLKANEVLEKSSKMPQSTNGQHKESMISRKLCFLLFFWYLPFCFRFVLTTKWVILKVKISTPKIYPTSLSERLIWIK